MHSEMDHDISKDWYIFAGCMLVTSIYFLVPSIFAFKYRRLPGLRHRGPVLTLLTGLAIFSSNSDFMLRLTVHKPINCMFDIWWIGVNCALIMSLIAAKAFRIVLLYRVSAAKYRMSRKTTVNMAFPPTQLGVTQDHTKPMANQTDGMAISVELKATQHEMYRAEAAQDQRSVLDQQHETKLAQFYYDVIGHHGPFRQTTLSAVPRRSSMLSTLTNPEGEDHQWPLDRGRKGALGHMRRVLSGTFSRRHTPRASNDTDNISLITTGNSVFKQHSSSAPSLLLHPRVLNSDTTGTQRMRSMSAAEITHAVHVVSSDASVVNESAHEEPTIPTALTSRTTVDQATVTPSHLRSSVLFLTDTSDNDWFYRHRHWNRTGCGIIAVVSVLLIQICVLVAVQVSTMSSPHTISDAFITCTTKRYWWILLGSIVLYTSVLLPFFIYQLRSVRDAFHIRTELLFSFISVTIFPIICLCFVLLPPKNAMAMHVYSYALLGILVGINVTLHAISTIFPLLEALRLDRISAMSVSFEEVMADTMNFEKFKVFCIIDFSVENVLFYERVKKLYQMFGHQRASTHPTYSQRNSTNHSRSTRNSTVNQDELSPLLKNELMHIYEMYIAPNAEYEVNLEHKTRKAIMDNVKRGNFYLTMYETALQEIVSLMTQDTFPRFLRWSAGYADSDENDKPNVCPTDV